MCGIFGHTNLAPQDVFRARDALHTLAHRGPDQWGEWLNDGIYIGHRRLSILDLSDNGRQPMMDVNEAIVIAVNGEVYNFAELRRALQKSHMFRSRSDSEVILHGYIEWGIDGLLNRIEGMYAFCIIDTIKKKCFLARDRVGIKPLYYAALGDSFAWASELKALTSFFGKDNLVVDNTALYDFLTYRYVPTPKTLFKNVYKLEPAHYLELDLPGNTFIKRRYWNLDVTVHHAVSIDDASSELKRLLRDSISQQMVSDVPVGFFLSGGLDSSTVVSEAVRASDKVDTYSIGFDVQSHSETEFAELVANHFHVQQHTKVLGQSDAVRMFSNLRQWYDEPFGDSSAFPTFLVSEHAVQGSTVVLTGDGGDEIFGGYKWYKRFRRIQSRKLKMPVALRNTLARLHTKFGTHTANRFFKYLDIEFGLRDLELYSRLLGSLTSDKKRRYRTLFDIPDGYDDLWYYKRHYRADLPVISRLQYLDFHTYLPDDILTKVDRASMAVSLEARVPLLSTDLITFSFSLPESIRLYNNQLKGLLKRTMRDTLPDVIINRDKKGFSVPMNFWQNDAFSKDTSWQETILHRLYGEELAQASSRYSG